MTESDKIIEAIYRRHRPSIDRIAREGDLNAPDNHGRFPLMHAVLAEDSDATFIKYLLDSGADPNSKDRAEWTSLAFAARDQKVEIVKILLDAGAIVDSTDRDGCTPLQRCVRDSRTNPEVVLLLRQHGADPYRPSNNGKSALDSARLRGKEDIVKLLA